MSNQIARLRQVGIGKEATKGTAVVPAFWVPVTRFNPNPLVTTKRKDGAIGRVESNNGSDIVTKHCEPAIEGYLTDKAAGLFFLLALGAVDTAAAVAGVYPHTFSVLNTNEHPSSTISFKDLTFSKQIPFSLANTLSIEAVVDDYVRFNASYIGKFEADGSLTPSFYATDNVFVGRHVSIKIADNIAGLAAANAVALQSASLEITKNAQAVFGLGSVEPVSVRNGQLEVSGNITAVQNDNTWRNLFIGNTKKAMEITIENSDVTIGSGSGKPKIVITLAQVDFNPYKEDDKLEDLIKESIDFTASFDLTTAKMIEVKVYNTQASY
jgi:hypothetical protein